MKIALIGYGKMGKAIERIALSRGHTISVVIDLDNRKELDGSAFKESDVAIEFTTTQTAVDNYYACFNAGVPVVSGTTGWLSRLDEIKDVCRRDGRTMFYASNFSIGVNVFFAVNKALAEMMNSFSDYNVGMTEIHHIHKLDSPSGTAITLAEDIIGRIDRISSWKLSDEAAKDILPIKAVREGEVPGTHEIRYESDVDSIVIRHEAKNRDGFALGAVLAAEYAADKRGFLGMEDMLHLNY